jgi:hypothetical protein
MAYTATAARTASARTDHGGIMSTVGKDAAPSGTPAAPAAPAGGPGEIPATAPQNSAAPPPAPGGTTAPANGPSDIPK